MLVKFTLEKKSRPVTRSTEEPPAEITPVVDPGRYYAIRADSRDYEDGFCISKVITCYSNHFRGVYLEKSETTDSTVSFKESKNVGHFDLHTVDLKRFLH